MRAIVFQSYGPPDVLRLKEVAKPTPKDNEVLIRIFAATVTPGDCEIRRFKIHPLFWLPLRIYMGLGKPRDKVQILGQELAGKIETVGKDVKRLRQGDQVFANTGIGFGAYAEYKCLPEEAVAIKPANMTYEEAAAVPTGGRNALSFLRRANIQKGQRVLVNGASGCFGTFAVQIAKYFGAEVTGVDATGKLDVLRSIGADEVVDYTKEDFTKNGKIYDVIFDVVGRGSLFWRARRSLKKNGVYLLTNPLLPQMMLGPWTALVSSKKLIWWFAAEKNVDLVFLKELVETGKIRSVIDRRYPLEEMAEAHRYVEEGQKTGHVVITLDHDKGAAAG